MHRAALVAHLLALAISVSACDTRDTSTPSPAASGASIDVSRPVDKAALSAPTAAPAPRLATDLPSCPGINPDIRRPAGSNCLGILPRECAADRVAGLVGSPDSPALRERVARTVAHANIRWIGFGEAVIENLDPTRLNISLDSGGRVTAVDCS